MPARLSWAFMLKLCSYFFRANKLGKMEESTKIRLDKWLWATRFFKSRGLATEAVGGGKVHVDGARVKPSRQISVGQTLEIQKGPYQFVVKIDKLLDKRVSATLAAAAYTESEESIQKRQLLQSSMRDERVFAQAERTAGRPSKRERRQLHRFKGRNANSGDDGDS